VPRRVFEGWSENEGLSITLTTAESAAEQRASGAIAADAQFLHRFEADTWEEAGAVHAIKMGWGGYQAPGEAAPCPHCGRPYYPEGSGECPNCGPVR
jgi:hypothetical protein